MLTELGARLLELHVPDRDGVPADVVLARPAPDVADDSTFMGATVGRCANRIRRGRVHVDGRAVQLSVGEDGHHLHGGPHGFDRRTWTAEATDGDVTFRRTSPAGEEGYPGTLTASVTYRLSGTTLSVQMRAVTDAPTIVNLAHHSYFNLGGHDAGTALDHVLQLRGSSYLPVDDDLLPTGEIRRVDGTLFDFRTPATIGDRGVAFDHNWVLDGDGMRDVAVLDHAGSGRRMTVSTDQPGLQFYAGEHLAGATGKGAVGTYPAFAGLALEAQNFPDAPNHSHFPSVSLLPGETYRNDVTFVFSVRR